VKDPIRPLDVDTAKLGKELSSFTNANNAPLNSEDAVSLPQIQLAGDHLGRTEDASASRHGDCCTGRPSEVCL